MECGQDSYHIVAAGVAGPVLAGKDRVGQGAAEEVAPLGGGIFDQVVSSRVVPAKVPPAQSTKILSVLLLPMGTRGLGNPGSTMCGSRRVQIHCGTVWKHKYM